MTPDDAASAFGAILRALSGVVSPALIDDAAWASLRDAVGDLPVEPGAGFGFELRLGESAAESDFWASLAPDGALAGHYAELGRRAPPGSPEAAFGRHLATVDADAPWAEQLIVEYDVAGGFAGGLPGYFAKMRPGAAGGGAEGRPGAEAVAAWFGGAVGWRVAEEEGRALAGALDGLRSAGGAVESVAVMPTRPQSAFKVVTRPAEPSRVPALAEGLGWSGRGADVRNFLSEFEGLFRSLRIAVDVGADGVLPRLGLELYQGTPGQVQHPGVGVWPPCLSRLRDEGLCLPEKLDGLMEWPGRELVFDGKRTYGLLTGLSGVKVSFEERESGVELEAKAYPYAGYLPFDEVVSRFGGGG